MISTYLLLIATVMGFFSTLIIIDGRGLEENFIYILALMFSPALLAMAVNLIFKRNLRGFGWGLGAKKYLLHSYLIPIVYILIPYSIALIFRLIQFDNGTLNNINILEIFKIFVINILILSIIVLGEEIGWRGFLLPQLCKIFSYRKASIIVGTVWVLAHYPIFIFSDYNNGNTPFLFRILCFTILAFSVNIIINWLRIKSGSIWTAVILHATHNSILQDIDPLFVQNLRTEYITSESGIALVLSGAILGFIYFKKQNELSVSLKKLKNIN